MFRYTDKQLVLEQSDVVKRLESLAKILQSEIEILEIEHGIHCLLYTSRRHIFHKNAESL